MIAIQNGPPLVELEDGSLTALEKSWLRHGITSAAQGAGYRKWWLADHIGAGVIEYFSRRVEERIVPVERIIEAVRAVLAATGYEDVAAHFAPPPPPVRVDLRQLAQAAWAGGELDFFSKLDAELASSRVCRARHLRVEGLRDAAKILLGARVWKRACERLTDEIVTHLRDRLGQAASAQSRSGQSVLLQIC